MMLARVADSLYWIGRYVERAEHLCRLSDVMLTATLEDSDAAAVPIRITGLLSTVSGRKSLAVSNCRFLKSDWFTVRLPVGVSTSV